jgi:hypothetical protein
MTKTLTVYFEATDKEVDIEVDFEYEVMNDGIGPYEYWGQKCFDKGTDSAVITSWEWDKTGFTPEEINIVEAEIERAKGDWEGEIEIDDGDIPDRDDE